MRKALRIVGIGLFALTILTLSSCEWIGSLFGQSITFGAITWTQDAQDWRDNTYWKYTVTLPAGGSLDEVWGTDVYTDDSSIGSAAVHAGKITFATGGTVTIEILPGRSSYTGSSRNGVTSLDWDEWYGSFRFVD